MFSPFENNMLKSRLVIKLHIISTVCRLHQSLNLKIDIIHYSLYYILSIKALSKYIDRYNDAFLKF